MNTYIALLRGINVGGRNRIKMTELKPCFERLGYHKVTTYIQSGNVWFQSTISTSEVLEHQIYKATTRNQNTLYALLKNDKVL